MVKRRNQSEHDKNVALLAAHLKQNGFQNIKVDISGYTQPVCIYWKGNPDGHIPDATASKDSTEYLFEVETDDTIEIQHTEDQWKLFSAHAKQHNKIFVVLVPEPSKQAAEQQIRKLNLSADVWTV